ncbi:MAG: rod shape-determining protein MreD [Elusimicrobia bacterium RIFCSPLOWO2_01_FULL_60_11]|nr:MAG: rod shape-determining protein MreD [Elusimicrobia bacterium RIFCSPLOWO2_01_FULL_60_11]
MKHPILFWVLTVFGVFTLHLAVAGNIAVLGAAPNFLLLSTVFFAVRAGPVKGEILGFIWGMLSDIASTSVFGSQAFMLTFVGYAVGKLEGKVDEDKYSAQMALVFIMSAVNLLGLALLESLFGGAPQRFKDKSILLGPFYSTLLCPVVYWGLLKWGSLFRRSDLKARFQ